MHFPRNILSKAKAGPYNARLTLIFVVLAAILEGTLAGYWFFILQPKLEGEISAYSHSLSQAQAEVLALALAEHHGKERVERLSLIMDKILLFRLPQSDKPFTKNISLEIDYDAIAAPDLQLDFSRGEPDPKNCLIIDIPLYSPTSKELLGIAQFSNNLLILDDLKQDVRTKLTFGSSLIILLLVIVWLTVARLSGRLSAYASELAQAHKTTQQIIASLQDARIVLDKNGFIVEINPYTVHILLYGEDELLGRHISSFMEDSSFLKDDHLLRFQSKLIMDNTELIFIARDGSRREVMVSAAFILSEQGELSGIICMGKDISALKNAERQLEEKRVQMEHQGRLSALGEMATGMAHEINQPLYIIRLAADCLGDYFSFKKPDSQEAGDVKKILDQVDRANTIITNMRSFARADVRALSGQNMAIPINLALSFFREQFRQHTIELHEDISDDLPMVLADPQKFEQIVVNFLSNARYAVNDRLLSSSSPYTPYITARLFREDEKIIFTVEDNGIGMDEETRNRCMEPFFTTKEVGQGTGLGLSIIHGIIIEMGMKIEIDSTPDQGSCFRVVMEAVDCD